MKVNVIGCSGSESPDRNLTSFLIDDFMLLDAGTIAHVLDNKAQKRITHILITHSHLDHIKGIPFFIENIVINNMKHHVTVLSGRDVLTDVKKNIFNDRIWPDFTAIYVKKNQVMDFKEIPLRSNLKIKNYKIYAVRVNHSVAAYGYIIEDSKGKSLVYTGDTGPTERLWQKMNRHKVNVLIIEVSFPNRMEELALKTGHLTVSLLERELKKMIDIPEKIYITHIKPNYLKVIEEELIKIKGYPIEVLKDNSIINV